MSVEFNVYKYRNVLAAHLKGVLPAGSIKNFHLALLIDQSGSMDGMRMNEVKNTLREMVRILKADDKISLITYNNNANILINCLKADGNLDIMNAHIDSIIADGGTNLESAFLKIPELAEVPDAVFILTDGIVNVGVMSSSGLQTIARSVLSDTIPISTVGYGPDHNQLLLRDLAIYSQGSYTFADGDEMIPAIVGDICAGLWTEVGRNAKINIPPSFEVFEVASTSTETFTIGTLIDNKSQWIVFKGTDASTLPESLTMTYVHNDGNIRSLTSGVIVHDSAESGIIVDEQYNRADVALTLFEATALIKSGSVGTARTILNDLIGRLEASISITRPMVVSLKARVQDMLSSIPTVVPSFPGLSAVRGGAFAGTMPSAGLLASTVSRLASATACVANQRGILSVVDHDDPSVPLGGAGVSHARPSRATLSMFSSPAQIHQTISLVTSTTARSPSSDGSAGIGVVDSSVDVSGIVHTTNPTH